MDLLKLVDQFQGKLQSNPPRDYAVRVNRFLAEVQGQGQDISRWGEDEWWEALTKLGVPEEELADMICTVASWSVVDNGVWE